jgi:hypothetical protein
LRRRSRLLGVGLLLFLAHGDSRSRGSCGACRTESGNWTERRSGWVAFSGRAFPVDPAALRRRRQASSTMKGSFAARARSARRRDDTSIRHRRLPPERIPRPASLPRRGARPRTAGVRVGGLARGLRPPAPARRYNSAPKRSLTSAPGRGSAPLEPTRAGHSGQHSPS